MKKYKVTVNGQEYMVEVEEVGGTPRAATAPKAPAAPSVSRTAAAVTAAPATAPAPVSVPAGGAAVKAPMPGTVLKLNVSEGEVVKKGQVLLIFEAMKMENEITAPADGTVAVIAVAQGSTCGVGDVLLTLA